MHTIRHHLHWIPTWHSVLSEKRLILYQEDNPVSFTVGAQFACMLHPPTMRIPYTAAKEIHVKRVAARRSNRRLLQY